MLCLCHDLVVNTQRLAAELPEVDCFLGGHEHIYLEAPDRRFVIAGWDFEDFCLALARVGLAHGAGKVSGEPDPIRALLVVIASSDGFAQAQRTPSRKSLRDFSPPSPMAALQL